MTAQVPDAVEVDGTTYELVAVRGAGLFDPADHGLRTVMTTTAHHRGYVACYAVRAGRLVLDRLEDVGLAAHREGVPLAHLPRVAGVAPAEGGLGLVYPELDLPVPFSGDLLVADGLIAELYVHMGFHAPWKYERVLELHVEAGAVVEILDRSAELAAVRGQILLRRRADPDDTGDVVSWIGRTFTQDYERGGL